MRYGRNVVLLMKLLVPDNDLNLLEVIILLLDESKHSRLSDIRVFDGRVHFGRHSRNVVLSGTFVQRTPAVEGLPS